MSESGYERFGFTIGMRRRSQFVGQMYRWGFEGPASVDFGADTSAPVGRARRRDPPLLLQAIGSSLPAALAIALSPFPVIGVVLLLAGRRGGRNGVLFAIGWVAGLAAVAALVLATLSGADDPDSMSAALADWLRVFAGAALVAVGVRKWWTRPRAGDEVEVPGWMAALGDATARRSLMLGALLSGTNPKNFVLTAAATAEIIETGVHGGDLVIAVIGFVLLGSCTVVGAVIAHFVCGPRAAALLDSVREFMVANNTVIMVLVLLILGANVFGEGLAGLGR